MAVNSTNITSGPYIGNGITTAFPYTFRVDEGHQLAVYHTDQNGVETLLVLQGDYFVSGEGADGGGTVTLFDPLPVDNIIYIRGDYKPTQLTEFSSQGGFFPQVHEAAMDKITFLIQQLLDISDRSLRLSDNDTSSIDMILPTPQAGHSLIWNDNEDGFENSIHNLTDQLSQAIAAAVASAVSATASSDSATASSDSATASSDSATAAEDWAITAEDTPVPISSGGDGSSEYSALHYAAKALAITASDSVVKTSLTGSAILPSGSNAQRDASPTEGYTRYNSDSGHLEAYIEGNWHQLLDTYGDQIIGGQTTMNNGTSDVPLRLESTDTKVSLSFEDDSTSLQTGVSVVGNDLSLDSQAVPKWGANQLIHSGGGQVIYGTSSWLIANNTGAYAVRYRTVSFGVGNPEFVVRHSENKWHFTTWDGASTSHPIHFSTGDVSFSRKLFSENTNEVHTAGTIFTGRVNAAGTVVSGTSGFSVTSLGQGDYLITHNLNTLDYTVDAILNIGGADSISTVKALNDFFIYAYSGVLSVPHSTSFTLILDI